MGSTSAFLAVSVSAIEQGGPAMLATLIIASALVQFVLGARMALLRRIFTPTVAGTVLILIPVTLAPMIVRKLAEVPVDASPAGGPRHGPGDASRHRPDPASLHRRAEALGTGRRHRRGRPDRGSRVRNLRLGNRPRGGLDRPAGDLAHPGVDLSFRPEFWALLPSFIMVTLVGAMDTLGDSIAIQRVSWRRPRAIDFRSIQGAISADGVGNLLSGLAGTVPNTTYGMSISVAELTGVASRAIGIAVGVVFVALAFLPKFVTLIVAMPGPVVAAYFVVIVALIFVFGMKILLQDGLDHRKGLIVGVAFWVGFAFQLDWIYPEYWRGAWGELLGNGMTVGGYHGDPAHAVRGADRGAEIAPEDAPHGGDVAGGGRIPGEVRRTQGVGREDGDAAARGGRGDDADPDARGEREGAMHAGAPPVATRAHGDGGAADLEFIATTDQTNLEDQLAMLSEGAAKRAGRGRRRRFRLLRHYASSIRHQQYHDIDILAIRVGR